MGDAAVMARFNNFQDEAKSMHSLIVRAFSVTVSTASSATTTLSISFIAAVAFADASLPNIFTDPTSECPAPVMNQTASPTHRPTSK